MPNGSKRLQESQTAYQGLGIEADGRLAGLAKAAHAAPRKSKYSPIARRRSLLYNEKHFVMPTRRVILSVLRRLLALAALAGIALFGAAVWDHRTSVELPPPTGSYAVGRTAFVWTNPDRIDDGLGGHPPGPREPQRLAVWIWYPAAPSSAPPAGYLPPAWRAALAEKSGFIMSQLLTRDLALVRNHALADPPAASGSFPVLIVRPGASALTTDLTTLAEDLASHGYVVCGFDAPHRTFVTVLEDGRAIPRSPDASLEESDPASTVAQAEKLLPLWTTDMHFVLAQLARYNDQRFSGSLDLARIGAFGHSFGGAAALQFCREEPRCQAAVDLDGIPFGSVVREGSSRPYLILLSDHGNLESAGNKEALNRITAVLDHLPPGRWLAFVRGTNHFSFTDQILLKNRLAVNLIGLLTGGTDKRRGLAIAAAYTRTYFDVVLRRTAPEAFDRLSSQYPEVRTLRK